MPNNPDASLPFVPEDEVDAPEKCPECCGTGRIASEGGFDDWSCPDCGGTGVLFAADGYHVTRRGPSGVYGHETSHCDEGGCSADELWLGPSGEVLT